MNSAPIAPIANAVKKLIFEDGKDCGCEERKKKLNQMFRSKRTPVRCLTEPQYNYLKSVIPTIRGEVAISTMNEIAKIHAGVFNYHFSGVCSKCGAKNRSIINDMNAILDQYKPENE